MEVYLPGFEDSFGVYESMEVILSPVWSEFELEFRESGAYMRGKLNF